MTTTPARARTSRVTRTTTIKEREVYFVYLDYKMRGLWEARTSSYLVLAEQPEEHQQPQRQQFQLQGTSNSPSRTCLQGASLPSTSSTGPAGTRTTTTTTTTTSASVSTGTTSTIFYLSIVCDKRVHTRTSHLRHQLHQQQARLRNGYADILLICNNISFPVRFYICDVKAPLLGLHDIFDSGDHLALNGKDSSTIEYQGETEPLITTIGVTSSLMPWLSTSITRYINIGFIHYTQQHGFDNDRCILMNDIDEPQHLGGEAQQPQSLRLPFYHPKQNKIHTH